jgi:hypothetical protein
LVAVGAGHQHIAAALRAVVQLLAQLGDVDLQALGRGRRRPLAPQLVDEPVRGHDLVAVQHQQREQRSALATAHRDGTLAVVDLQRSEQAEVHVASYVPTVTTAA